MRKWLRARSFVFAVLAGLGAVSVAGCASEVSDLESASDAFCIGLLEGERMDPGTSIVSCDDNRTHLVMQHDGNLVLYGSSGAALWHSHTYDHPGAFAVLRSEGLVVYAPDGHTRLAIARADHYATFLIVERDAFYLVAHSLGEQGRFPAWQ